MADYVVAKLEDLNVVCCFLVMGNFVHSRVLAEKSLTARIFSTTERSR